MTGEVETREAKVVYQASTSRGLEGPQLMPIDVQMLGWLGQQYGGTYEHLRHLAAGLGDGNVRSESAVRQRVARWTVMGLVRKQRRLGSVWVTPTRRGYEAASQGFAPWQAPLPRIEHCDAVNRTRLWYEASTARVAQQGRWVSERTLFSERGRQGSWHISDAELRTGAGAVTGMEIELHVKTPARRYVDEVVSRLRSDVAVMVYLCPPQFVERVRASLEWAVTESHMSSSLRVFVRPLPELRASQSSTKPRS